MAADIHLRDDYLENARGIRVEDDLVSNDYHAPGSGKANPHKSYGYLRAPELSRHVARFLAWVRSGFYPGERGDALGSDDSVVAVPTESTGVSRNDLRT